MNPTRFLLALPFFCVEWTLSLKYFIFCFFWHWISWWCHSFNGKALTITIHTVMFIVLRSWRLAQKKCTKPKSHMCEIQLLSLSLHCTLCARSKQRYLCFVWEICTMLYCMHHSKKRLYSPDFLYEHLWKSVETLYRSHLLNFVWTFEKERTRREQCVVGKIRTIWTWNK